MNDTAVRALEAIGSSTIRRAFRHIVPTASMTTGEMAAFQSFSQMWSAMWGVLRPLDREDQSSHQAYGKDVLTSKE